MDELYFNKKAEDELDFLEIQFDDIDPDDVELSSSEGVLKLELRNKTVIVINTQRPARQIWMAAVASAWRFNFDETRQRWFTDNNEEFRQVLSTVIHDEIDLKICLSEA